MQASFAKLGITVDQYTNNWAECRTKILYDHAAVSEAVSLGLEFTDYEYAGILPNVPIESLESCIFDHKRLPGLEVIVQMAGFGKKEHVHLMVEAHNVPDDHEIVREAFEQAARYGHLEVIQLLESYHNPKKTNALEMAARYNHESCVTEMLQFIKNPKKIYYALDNAATFGHVTCFSKIYNNNTNNIPLETLRSLAAKAKRFHRTEMVSVINRFIKEREVPIIGLDLIKSSSTKAKNKVSRDNK